MIFKILIIKNTISNNNDYGIHYCLSPVWLVGEVHKPESERKACEGLCACWWQPAHNDSFDLPKIRGSGCVSMKEPLEVCVEPHHPSESKDPWFRVLGQE